MRFGAVLNKIKAGSNAFWLATTTPSAAYLHIQNQKEKEQTVVCLFFCLFVLCHVAGRWKKWMAGHTWPRGQSLDTTGIPSGLDSPREIFWQNPAHCEVCAAPWRPFFFLSGQHKGCACCHFAFFFSSTRWPDLNLVCVGCCRRIYSREEDGSGRRRRDLQPAHPTLGQQEEAPSLMRPAGQICHTSPFVHSRIFQANTSNVLWTNGPFLHRLLFVGSFLFNYVFMDRLGFIFQTCVVAGTS